MLVACTLFSSDGTPASCFSTGCCCYCPRCSDYLWNIRVRTLREVCCHVLQWSHFLRACVRKLERHRPTQLTQFQVSDLKEYADYLFCCVLCVLRFDISMNSSVYMEFLMLCPSLISIWFVEPYSPPTVSSQRLCRFSCCVSQGFFFLCCASAPIDNLHFIVCENCSAAQ